TQSDGHRWPRAEGPRAEGPSKLGPYAICYGLLRDLLRATTGFATGYYGIRYGRRGGAPGCAAPGCTAPGTIMPGTATAPNGAIFAGTFFGISGTMPFGSTPGRRVSCAWGMKVVGLWFACPGATSTVGGRSTGAASSYGDDST